MALNWKRGAQGAMTGGGAGAMTGNPWVAGGGALTGGLIGLFSDDGSDERQRGAQEAQRMTEQFARQQQMRREDDLRKALAYFGPANQQMERLYGIKMPDPVGAMSQIGQRAPMARVTGRPPGPGGPMTDAQRMSAADALLGPDPAPGAPTTATMYGAQPRPYQPSPQRPPMVNGRPAPPPTPPPLRGRRS